MEKTIIIKVTSELKEKISKKSKKNGLTMGSYIKVLIMKDLENE